jgi:hypothetical protein
MRYSNRGPFRQQVNFLRRQFLQDGDLPFTDVLTEGLVAKALAAVTGWLDRIYSPLRPLPGGRLAGGARRIAYAHFAASRSSCTRPRLPGTS